MGVFGGFSSGAKVGMIQPFSGSVIPDGWLKCDGSAISRTLYSELFDVIGTTYGSGDGSTTFNIPNYSSARMVTSSNIPVKGTGMCLGMTDGTNLMGTIVRGDSGAAGAKVFSPYTVSYGYANGVSVSGATTPTNNQAVGVTIDPEKSGIIGTASLASACNCIIKY